MSSRPAVAARKSTRGEYIETDSGNKVSRRACITGTANITLGGKTVICADVHLRGDLTRLSSSSSTGQTATAISIGRYTVVSCGTVVKPPSRVSRGVYNYYPLKIGDNVFVGPSCVIQSTSISSHVHVGESCVLQPFSIIKENCKILPNTVIPPFMVVPAGSVVGGQPGRILGEVGEGWGISPGAAAGGNTGDWVEGGDLRELVRSIR